MTPSALLLALSSALLLIAPASGNCLGKIAEHPVLEIKVGVKDGADGTWRSAGIGWARTDGKMVYKTTVRRKDPVRRGAFVEGAPESVPVVDIFNAAAAEQSMPLLDQKAAKEGGEATVSLMLIAGESHAAWRIDGAANPKAAASCKKLIDLPTPLLTDEQRAELEGPEPYTAWNGNPELGGWQIHFSLQEPYKSSSTISREIGFIDVPMQGQQAVIVSGNSQVLLDPKDGEQMPSKGDGEMTVQEHPAKLPEGPLTAAMAAFQKAATLDATPRGGQRNPKAWFSITAGQQGFFLISDAPAGGKNKAAVDGLYGSLKKLLSPAEVKQLERKY